MKLPKTRCGNCGHEWEPRRQRKITCPTCKTDIDLGPTRCPVCGSVHYTKPNDRKE